MREMLSSSFKHMPIHSAVKSKRTLFALLNSLGEFKKIQIEKKRSICCGEGCIELE